MNTTLNQKQCWKCEEIIHNNAEECPYCGTDFFTSPSKNTLSSTSNPTPPPFQEELHQSTEAPPPPFHSSEFIEQESSKDPLVMNNFSSDLDSSDSNNNRGSSDNSDTTNTSSKTSALTLNPKVTVLPLVLLTTGSVFFLFGLVLFLFSTDGKFTLQWNGNFWPLYLLSSFPLFYFGWNYLQELENKEMEA